MTIVTARDCKFKMVIHAHLPIPDQCRKQVDDRTYHAILETVFRVTKLDISAISRASKYTSSKIATRISAGAGLVRTIVEVGLSKLRSKTVKALIEHIIQSLPTADAGYCEPLVLDYFKALATLLGFKAHVEHLSSEDWRELIDFCIDTARDLNRTSLSSEDSVNDESIQGSLRSRSNRTNTPGILRDRQNTFSSHQPGQPLYPQLQGSNEDILLCIRHLTTAPNAPFLEKADVMLTVLLDLLASYQHSGKIQQSSYEVIGCILSRIISSDKSLALRTMTLIIPLIRASWQRASQGLREILLTILLRGEVLFSPSVASAEISDVTSSFAALLDTMKDQYCTRKPREQLILDDFDLSDTAPSPSSQVPQRLRCASQRFGMFKGEESWATVYVCASIYAVLDHRATASAKGEQMNDSRPHAKRQKRARPLEDLLLLMRGNQRATRMFSLQVAAFVFDRYHFDLDLLQNFLDAVLQHLSDDDGLITSWAIFALARYGQDPNTSQRRTDSTIL